MKQYYITASLLAFLFFIPTLATLYTDFLWHEAQGYQTVFWTTLTYQLSIFVAVLTFTLLFFFAIRAWTKKCIKNYSEPGYIPFILVLAGLFIATTYAQNYLVVLKYLNSYAFTAIDPVFNKNIAFYVYQLPFFELITGYLLLLATLALLSVIGAYVYNYKQKPVYTIQPDGTQTLSSAFNFQIILDKIKKRGYTQILLLIALIVLLNASTYFLARYQLLFSTQGTVYGVGFVEQHILLIGYSVLVIIGIIAALILLFNTRKKNDTITLSTILIVTLAPIVLTIIAFATQAIIVEPDELNRELPFIEQEIRHTRDAFGLTHIERRELEVSEELTAEQLQRHQPTIENVRLWDDRPLLTTLNEIQIFRTYYAFPTIDVDRYMIDGQRRLVMLAAREVDTRGLSPQSQTWVNRHLVYTHGFGVAKASASETTTGNFPQLLIQDIPPRSTTREILEPRIYYGKNTHNYVIVNTKTPQLDFPSGEGNVFTHYTGTGGVLLDSTLKRLAYAIHMRAPQILFSGSITDESRIQYHRTITDRARKLAPYLLFDADPYIVIGEDGILYWIQDAYTYASTYPYSNPVRYQGRTVNYIRNSVKIVVDAYEGTTTFYVAEPNEPLIRTFMSVYPVLYRSLSELPAGLEAHIRYPQDLFSIQANRYQDYHMTNPAVFYNREDSWRIPNEVVRGREQPLRPYYQIMQLPGETEAEFIQVQPFIPRGRENLIGWLAARSDGEHYGELRAYHFSKQELTFGPMQVESRIDQDTEISQQITLWSRAGSGVVRGNLLVIPIDNSILYIEPLFLEAREQGSLPQLMRAIVVLGESVVMAPTVQQALDMIIDPTVTPPTISTDDPLIITDTAQIQRIREAFRSAQEALNRGDLRLYADRVDELERLLQ